MKAVRVLRLIRTRLAFLGHGVSLGRRPVLEGRRPRLQNAGTMRIGDHLVIRGQQFPAALSTGPDGQLVLGNGVLVNQGATIHAAMRVEIGDGVKIADLAAIYDTDFHEIEPGAGIRVAPVVIGRNAWIGRAAIVLPGVTVGADAVVAAGAVVTADVAPATLVAGVPARAVRSLEQHPGYLRH